MQNSKKPRILYLLKILSEETDENVGLSLPEIQARLEDFGISCERKSLYRDFKGIEDFGIEIGKISARPVQYYLKSRAFEPAQISLLTDAVQTSKALTKNSSQTLIRRLKKLVSNRDAQKIDLRILVPDRVKSQNDSIFTQLDSIQTAISEKRDISFAYVKYDVNKKLHDVESHDGKQRKKTPLFLVYNNEYYYMLAYDEEAADHVRSYRVDRMKNIMVLDESDASHRPDADFNISEYENEVLGMYNGEPTSIVLQVAEDVVGSIIDIFGIEGVNCYPAEGVVEEDDYTGGPRNWANMHVKAAPSPVFFGHIAQFGGDVRIVGPVKVVRAYEEHLSRALHAQEL